MPNLPFINSGANFDVDRLSMGSIPGSNFVTRRLRDKLYESVSVKDFGAVGDGSTDNQSIIDSATDHLASSGGGALYFPPGVYRVNDELTAKSGIRYIGAGAGMSIIQTPSSGFGGTKIFRNLNWDATALTDHDITFEHLGFDYNGNFTGATHAIYMRYVDRVRVLNCNFTDGNNGTALLACRDTVTRGCWAFNQSNCAFDHWDGAQSAVVDNCIVRGNGNPAQGIQFTGASSAGGARDAFIATIVNNHVFDVDGTTSRSAILINYASNGSSNDRVIVANNHIENAGIGIGLEGSNHIVSGNIIKGTSGLGVLSQANGASIPSGLNVINNLFVDCVATAGNIAMISFTSGSDHVCRGNRIIGGTYPNAVRIASGVENCIIGPNDFPSGSSGFIVDAGTGTIIIEQRSDLWLSRNIDWGLFQTTDLRARLMREFSGGNLTLKRASSSATAPGDNYIKVYVRDGTNSGTLKLCVRAGSSGAETTLLDNIPQS
jgi:hypothetical protein